MSSEVTREITVTKAERKDWIKNNTEAWAEQVSYEIAMSELLSAKLSVATADRLCRGAYKHTPNETTVAAVINAMARTGFSVPSGIKVKVSA
jgi:hypothetical protein